jgi:fructokinase
MNTDKPIFIGAGELLWDLLPSGKQLGGAPANFAYHAQQLGAQSYVISAVGNDKNGEEIIDLLIQKGMNVSYISKIDGFPTGTVSVNLNNEGVPDFVIHQEVAWDYIAALPEADGIVQKADAFCFGSLAQRKNVSSYTVQALLTKLPEKCLTIFDINLRQNFFTETIIDSSLHFSDVLKLNEDELPVVARLFKIKGSEEDILKSLLQKYKLKMIALTKGANGSLLITETESSWLDTPKVKVADTVGAGDSFTAAIAVGVLKGMPLKKIHSSAVEISAFVCTQKGAMPELTENILKKLFK